MKKLKDISQPVGDGIWNGCQGIFEINLNKSIRQSIRIRIWRSIQPNISFSRQHHNSRIRDKISEYNGE